LKEDKIHQEPERNKQSPMDSTYSGVYVEKDAGDTHNLVFDALFQEDQTVIERRR
jgi:hypothetical protein